MIRRPKPAIIHVFICKLFQFVKSNLTDRVSEVVVPYLIGKQYPRVGVDYFYKSPDPHDVFAGGRRSVYLNFSLSL